MITLNTKIDESKLIKPEKSAEEAEDEVFFSVKCKICSEEIGAYEVKNKIYHFFNVVPGLGWNLTL